MSPLSLYLLQIASLKSWQSSLYLEGRHNRECDEDRPVKLGWKRGGGRAREGLEGRPVRDYQGALGAEGLPV